jgi:hypothetical protein
VDQTRNRGGHGIQEKVVVEELTAAGLEVEKIVGVYKKKTDRFTSLQ